ncbi:MAG: cation:proton antiporter [Schleiferiaceae bacterium]|jgi:Kef-type K+ transport system membrane component KefB
MEHLPALHLPFFANLLLLLVLARVFGEVMERFKQPAMIGEILAGVVLGPTMLNIMVRNEELKVISELGVFLLVIIAGLEINIRDIAKTSRGRNLITSLLAFFIPIGSGFAVAKAFDLELVPSIFVGLCVAITALPVSVRILMDLGQLKSEVGQHIISVAIFDDVLALTILGVLLDVNSASDSSIQVLGWTIALTLGKILLLMAGLVLAYRLINKLTDRENFIEAQLDKLLQLMRGKESLLAIMFAFILIFASLTEAVGLHFIIGAFFASMLLSKELLGAAHFHEFEKTTHGMAMGFLAPIFFAGIGLEFQFSSISEWGLLAAIIGVSFGSKIVGGYLGARFAGLRHRKALTLGIGLNARGIMELVIANIAYREGLIGVELFSILVIMGVVTTLNTPMLLKRSFTWLSAERDEH